MQSWKPEACNRKPDTRTAAPDTGIFLTSHFILTLTFLTFAVLSSALCGAGMVTRLRKLEPDPLLPDHISKLVLANAWDDPPSPKALVDK